MRSCFPLLRHVALSYIALEAMGCPANTTPPKASTSADKACVGCLTDNPIVVDDGPKAVTPTTAVVVKPAKTPGHFRNARAYENPTDKAWLTMAYGITLLVQPYKAPRIEGGEAVWELAVHAFPREGQNIVTAKSDQYGVRIAEPKWPRSNAEPGTFTFRVILRAPIECSSDTVDTEAHVVLEFIRPGDKKRLYEAPVTLDDLCVNTLSTRPFLDPKEMLSPSE